MVSLKKTRRCLDGVADAYGGEELGQGLMGGAVEVDVGEAAAAGAYELDAGDAADGAEHGLQIDHLICQLFP